MRVDDVGRPTEVLRLDILRGERKLDAARPHRGDIAQLFDLTSDALRIDRSDQVVVVAFVPIDSQIDPVVQKTQVGADVQFVLLFVG